jgi:hypothetical protein
MKLKTKLLITAILIIPGGIPVFIGVKLFNMYKKLKVNKTK